MTTPQLWEGETKMKTYRIEVSRTVEQTSYVEVEAEDRGAAELEAEQKADGMDVDEREWDNDKGMIEIGSVEVLEMEDDDVDDGDPEPEKKDSSEKEDDEEENENEEEAV